MLTDFGCLFIIRRVGKVGKLGRAGGRCLLERRRKLQQLHDLRTMERWIFPNKLWNRFHVPFLGFSDGV